MSKVITLASSGYQMSDPTLCGRDLGSGLPISEIPQKKICCILPSSPWLADSKTNVPLGVLYIAGLLRHHGHDVRVVSMLDKRYEGDISLPDRVMDSDVFMFGFCTPQFGEALELAAYIKDRRPEALVVAGGPHPSYEPQETKAAGRQAQYHVKGVLPKRRDYSPQDGSAPLFDTVIVMEGEVATLQMLSDWHQGALQPYYYGDKADAMDLDAIPFPAWDLLPEDHIYNDGVAVMKRPYVESSLRPGKYPVMSMIGTRGCPYKCTYCFIEGTLVDMADGSRRSIEFLEKGDFVLAFDRSTGYTQAQPVMSVGARWADDVYEIKLEDGTVLGVTGDHPFVTRNGWQRVRTFDSWTYVRRMRRTDNNDRSSFATKDVFNSVSNEGRSPTTWRNMACCSHEADGDFSAYSRNASKAERNAEEGFRRGAPSYTAEASGQAIRFSSCGNYQAEKTTETRHSRPHRYVGTDEIKQSDVRSRSAKAGFVKNSVSLLRRAHKASFACGIQRSRTSAVQLLCRSWITVDSLRWQTVLDRTLSVWKTAQSGYAALIGKASNSVFFPALAYVGGYGNSISGLHRAGLGGVELLGRFVADEREQELGDCPGERISGDWVRVVSITLLGRRKVYPISVAKHETFFAHGIATHNCSTPWIGQKPRYRSPANIIAEMKAVMDKGVHMFKFQDDTYTLHKTKLRELAEAIHAEFGPDSFASRIHTRVNTMNDHVAKSLKMMNCKVTCFGIESGSQRVLDANQKNTTVKQNTEAVINAKNHGFYTIAFLVIGMAGETTETMRETQEWLLSVKPYLDSCNLAVGIPYPGSRWWTHPQESGIDIVDYNYDNQWIVGFSDRDEILVRPHGATVDDMFKIKNEMFHFLVEHGWAKAEWQEDVRIRQKQEEAARSGVLPSAAASTLTYAGH